MLDNIIYKRKAAENKALSRESADTRLKVKHTKDWRIAFLFCTPAVLLLFIFKVFPLFFGFYISLFDWNIQPDAFIGFNNYAELFTVDLFKLDPIIGLKIGQFGQSLLVTLWYLLLSVPLAILLSFIIAHILFDIRASKLRDVLRIAFFLPYITSSISAIFIFRWMANTQYGIFNALLSMVGIARQEWMTDSIPVLEKLINAFGGTVPNSVPDELLGPTYALCIIIAYAIWNAIGFNVVVYLSGFSNIPMEIYESADIDGASKLQKIRHISVPLISPTTFLLSIVSVIGAFESFNAFYVFTGGEGGPGGSTTSFAMYIFKNFYQYSRAGYASALSVIMFIIVLGLTLIQKKFGDKYVFYNQ